MPRGDKSKYTDKQERKADHIAESYEARGVSEKEAWRVTAPASLAAAAPAAAPTPVIRRRTRAESWVQGVRIAIRSVTLGIGEESRRDAKAQQRRAYPPLSAGPAGCFRRLARWIVEFRG